MDMVFKMLEFLTLYVAWQIIIEMKNNRPLQK